MSSAFFFDIPNTKSHTNLIFPIRPLPLPRDKYFMSPLADPAAIRILLPHLCHDRLIFTPSCNLMRKAVEKRIKSADLWVYRQMLRVGWTEHRTDETIPTKLLGCVVRRKLSFFGHAIRDGGCELVKCVIQGRVSVKRRRRRPKTSYSSNITKWMSESMERITRDSRDRAGWRRLVRCAAQVADHHS